MFVDWFKNMSAMFVYVYEIYATSPLKNIAYELIFTFPPLPNMLFFS